MAHAQISKAHTANTGTANTFSYSGSFDTFKASEVVVLLDDTALTFTSSSINDSASPREYTVDTAAKNAANQQNAANAFNLTRDAQNALWQELRDKATFDYQGQQNQLDRLSRLIATALSHESVNASQDLGLGTGSLAEMFDMLID